MKKKLNLDELRVKSFVISDEIQIKKTVKGGGVGVGPWSYPCNYYTKEKFCGDTGFQGCNDTEVAICGYPTEIYKVCTSVSDGG